MQENNIRIYSIPKTRCKTKNGFGYVTGIEIASCFVKRLYGKPPYSWLRYQIELDDNPFNFSPCYYVEKEVEFL